MFSSVRARWATPIIALLLAASLASCAAATPPPPAAEQVAVTDPQGHRVDMPAEPQAALGFYTTDVDMLITLGFPLAKQQPIRNNYQTFPGYFPSESLVGITPFTNFPEYDYEKVLTAEPDFILNGLGYDDEVHPRLAEVAPTYTVDAFDGRNWEEHFARTAKDLGREDRYRAWKDQHNVTAETAKGEIADAGNAGLTAATLGYWEGQVHVNCSSGVECNVFDELGLKKSELSSDPDLGLSNEQLGRLKDVDVVWMGVGQGEAGRKQFDETMAELAKVPTWRELPFVKNKRIHTYDMEIQYGSPSGQDAFLDQVRKDLT